MNNEPCECGKAACDFCDVARDGKCPHGDYSTDAVGDLLACNGCGCAVPDWLRDEERAAHRALG